MTWVSSYQTHRLGSSREIKGAGLTVTSSINTRLSQAYWSLLQCKWISALAELLYIDILLSHLTLSLQVLQFLKAKVHQKFLLQKLLLFHLHIFSFLLNTKECILKNVNNWMPLTYNVFTAYQHSQYIFFVFNRKEKSYIS